MAIAYKLLVVFIFTITIIKALPSIINEPNTLISLDDENLLSTVESNPKLYLIIAEVLDTSDDNDDNTQEIITSINEYDIDSKAQIEKRSVENNDDLETAAGTNVLRPLFVYRQQLAYRQRVKGAVRRSGIRPKF